MRPTPDRVRETLFNWLGQDLSAWHTLELYAGSGALSLEALSRGAVLAVAVDRNATLVRNLAETARAFGLDGLESHVANAEAFIAGEQRRFDVIFLDPPFDSDPWPWLLRQSAARLRAGGYIYAEARRRLEPPGSLSLWRHAKAGQVHYHLLRMQLTAP